MATITANPKAHTVSMEEYLRTSYSPDVEYIDGELKEPSVVMSVHGSIQALLSAWFLQWEEEWKIRTAVEVRIRVAPDRVRLPDVIVDHARFWPETLVVPPLLVVEVLSPTETYSEMRRKIEDYLAMGIKTVWIIDPETRTGEVYGEHSEANATHLTVAGTSLYVDLEAIFARLDKYQQEPTPPTS